MGSGVADFVRVLKIKCDKKHETFEQIYPGPHQDGIKPGEKATGENAIRIGCSTKATINKGKKGTTYDTTCKGKLIQCDYYVQARFVPGTCCFCGSHPKVRFPVHMTVPFIQMVPAEMDDWSGDVTQVQPFVANIEAVPQE